MENLKTKISADHISAFKNKEQEKKSILSVVKGEIQTVEKNTNVQDLPDDGVVKILNKLCKSLQETIDASGDAESVVQLTVLRDYLPKQLTQEEVTAKISEIKASNPGATIGDVMKAFAGLQVDRKMVSQVFTVIRNSDENA